VRNAFEQLASSRDIIMHQVDEQYMLLRNQMLKLILRGDSECIERAKVGYMDINLSGTVLFVGIVQSVDEREIQQLQAFGESVFWCKGLQDDVYTAIVSTDSEGHAIQIKESLQQHFEAIDRQIVFSEFIDDPYQICTKAADTYKRLTAKPPLRKSTVNADDIVEYIRTNYQSNDLSLNQLAEVFNISPHYISTLVYKQTNQNYKEFLTDIRMKHAQKLVLEGKLMTKEIAEAVGYTNVSLFIKTYKATFGVTPSNSKQCN
jgi:YesN/AraC family two-component response regulator